jgi:rRNA maturation protein Nop10
VTSSQPIAWEGHAGQALDAVAGFTVIECELCGFRHAVPTPAEFEPVNAHDYYAVEKPLYLERMREDLEWWEMVYDERYDLLESLLPPAGTAFSTSARARGSSSRQAFGPAGAPSVSIPLSKQSRTAAASGLRSFRGSSTRKPRPRSADSTSCT